MLPHTTSDFSIALSYYYFPFIYHVRDNLIKTFKDIVYVPKRKLAPFIYFAVFYCFHCIFHKYNIDIP